MKTDKDIFDIYRGERGVGCNHTLFTQHNFIPTPKNLRILEVGFGQGELSRYLIREGNSYYGIDVGEESIKGAIKDGFVEDGTFLYMDASRERLPFLDDFFDQVYMLETIEHLSNPVAAMFEIKRVLKDNGELIISHPGYEKQGCVSGRHAHVIPGLLAKDNFYRFMVQFYFRPTHMATILGSHETSDTYLWHFINSKNAKSVASTILNLSESQPNIFNVAAGNYSEHELYGHLDIEGLVNLKEFSFRWVEPEQMTEDEKRIFCTACGKQNGHKQYFKNNVFCIFCRGCSRIISSNHPALLRNVIKLNKLQL